MANTDGALVICLTLKTLSRARAVSGLGPRPIRTRRWPWGLPSVGGTARADLEADNKLIRLALSALKEVISSASDATVLWLAPEDRGGDSANLWQFPELREFSRRHGLFRYSFNQCEFEPVGNATTNGSPFVVAVAPPGPQKRLAPHPQTGIQIQGSSSATLRLRPSS